MPRSAKHSDKKLRNRIARDNVQPDASHEISQQLHVQEQLDNLRQRFEAHWLEEFLELAWLPPGPSRRSAADTLYYNIHVHIADKVDVYLACGWPEVEAYSKWLSHYVRLALAELSLVARRDGEYDYASFHRFIETMHEQMGASPDAQPAVPPTQQALMTNSPDQRPDLRQSDSNELELDLGLDGLQIEDYNRPTSLPNQLSTFRQPNLAATRAVSFEDLSNRREDHNFGPSKNNGPFVSPPRKVGSINNHESADTYIKQIRQQPTADTRRDGLRVRFDVEQSSRLEEYPTNTQAYSSGPLHPALRRRPRSFAHVNQDDLAPLRFGFPPSPPAEFGRGPSPEPLSLPSGPHVRSDGAPSPEPLSRSPGPKSGMGYVWGVYQQIPPGVVSTNPNDDRWPSQLMLFDDGEMVYPDTGQFLTTPPYQLNEPLGRTMASQPWRMYRSANGQYAWFHIQRKFGSRSVPPEFEIAWSAAVAAGAKLPPTLSAPEPPPTDVDSPFVGVNSLQRTIPQHSHLLRAVNSQPSMGSDPRTRPRRQYMDSPLRSHIVVPTQSGTLYSQPQHEYSPNNILATRPGAYSPENVTTAENQRGVSPKTPLVTMNQPEYNRDNIFATQYPPNHSRDNVRTAEITVPKTQVYHLSGSTIITDGSVEMTNEDGSTHRLRGLPYSEVQKAAKDVPKSVTRRRQLLLREKVTDKRPAATAYRRSDTTLPSAGKRLVNGMIGPTSGFVHRPTMTDDDQIAQKFVAASPALSVASISSVQSNTAFLDLHGRTFIRPEFYSIDDGNDPESKMRSEIWIRELRKFRQVAVPAKSRGAPVRVTVIDTGIDGTHPFLRGGGGRSKCGSAKKPKWTQYSDGAMHPLWKDLSELDPSACSEEAVDVDGHGTFIAGLLLYTVPGIELSVIRIGKDSASIRSDVLITRKIELAIRYALDTWAPDIMTMSFSCPETPSLCAAVREALSRNVTILAAAGNAGYNETLKFPATMPGVFKIFPVTDTGKDFFATPLHEMPSGTQSLFHYHTLGRSMSSIWSTQCPEARRPRSYHVDDRMGPMAVMAGSSFSVPMAAALVAIVFTMDNARRFKVPAGASIRTAEGVRMILSSMSRLIPQQGYKYLRPPTTESVGSCPMVAGLSDEENRERFYGALERHFQTLGMLPPLHD